MMRNINNIVLSRFSKQNETKNPNLKQRITNKFAAIKLIFILPNGRVWSRLTIHAVHMV